MALSNLVRAGGLGAVVVSAGVAVLAGASGCHNGAAGGRNDDAAVDNASEVMAKLPPPDANCPADAAGGGGQCPNNFCGAPKAVSTLALGEVAELGADGLCGLGSVCVPDVPSASGDALLLRCVQPFTPSIQFGAACTKGTGATNRCKSDALCIEAPGTPGQTFCSALCRADADCPADAACLEYKSATLPNGSYVNLGFCTPKAKITGAVCASEADCPADQGCVAYGARTNLLSCQKVGGTKSVGDKCAKGSECRSGQCYDRAFHADVASNQSFCSARCTKSSDCGADQRCARVVFSTNGTPADPRDDLVIGLCQTLFVPVAADGCKQDADCTTGGADTCSKPYGLCYKAGAASGAPCAADEGCALGATCTGGPRFPDGYCQTLGCAPGAAAGSVDSCPGAHPACVQRGSETPLHACYEGCSQSGDCSRFMQSYVCESPAPGGATSTGDAGASDAAASEAGGAGASDAASDAVSGGEAGASEAGAPTSICIYDLGV